MARIIGIPKFMGFDNNGDPLSGGLLYTYEVNSTTNKATYPTIADAVATTNANTNPVVLDSRGEANVVISGDTKLVLKTSAGVTLWTVDYVKDAVDIYDSNGNEMLLFNTVSSATNYIDITNAATGNPPLVSAKGSDTNISLALVPKGTGSVKLDDITGYTTNDNLTLTPNGTGVVVIDGLTWPSADGSNGHALKTNGSGTLSFGAITASPGGSNTQMQYNNAGTLAGDSGTVTNGSGTVTITGQLNVDNLRMDGQVISATSGALVPSKVPTFLVTMSADQSVNNVTDTKVNFDTETLDNLSYYDTTNKKWLPTTAGYYMCTATVGFTTSSAANGWLEVKIFKNGSGSKNFQRTQTSNGILLIATVSTLQYCNGTTDYLECYVYHSSGASKTIDSSFCSFGGYLVTQA